jgi:hypothetical protein
MTRDRVCLRYCACWGTPTRSSDASTRAAPPNIPPKVDQTCQNRLRPGRTAALVIALNVAPYRLETHFSAACRPASRSALDAARSETSVSALM